MSQAGLRCDGCGQIASSGHIAQRLQRLEWSTRYRPVHIGTLLLGAVAPLHDSDFIYSPTGAWEGEAKVLLAVAGVMTAGKAAEVALSEFQRGGFFLTYVLECPSEDSAEDNVQQLLGSRLTAVMARIRRSLQPKRLVPVSQALERFLPALRSGHLSCAILLDQGKPFVVEVGTAAESTSRLREALTSQSASAHQGSGAGS
jgi:hypothetical protein